MTSIRNLISVVGAVLATVGAVLFLVVFALDLFGLHTNPYIGILFFLVFPSIFVVGLLLIPFGAWLERRRVRRGAPPSQLRWPRIDLNDPQQRTTVFAVVVLTLVNVVIVSLAGYRGVEYMDSVEFCGQLCHEVMEPEFVAYQNGPHARVACVQCHIGPGAPWFVRSKLSGMRQVAAVLFNTHSRPIPSPVENLRPAREVCEQCHWPDKFHGDKVEVVREYADDEENTESTTTLRIHVGGGSEALGVATGIHWHMNLANEIEYITTDDRRQEIPYVRLRDPQGRVREFRLPGVTDEQLAAGERRRMDCMDCHNRPSHPFDATASRAVDQSIAIDEIPRTLPFAKREAVAVLQQDYANQEAAATAIAERLRAFYGAEYPQVLAERPQDVDRAVTAVQNIYRRNIFPSMNVRWGSYPNNIGHTDFPGCFRCHDDSHEAEDGSVIRQDCDICHTLE